MANYVLTLPIKTELWQEDILLNEFNKYRKVYNACLSELFKRYKRMVQSKEYLSNCKYTGKGRNKIFTELNNKYGLTEYSLHSFVKPMGKYYNLHSAITQKIATRVFNAFKKYMTHKAEKVNFIRYGELYSIEGKQNSTGISYKNGIITFNRIKVPVVIKGTDLYAQKAVQDKVKYCRLLKKEIHGKSKWYVQLILGGIPPQKEKTIGTGKVGIDIGTQTIAVSSENEVKLLELAPNINNISREIKLLQRKMDRSKRATNTDKYNADGTINTHNKAKWVYSNHYLKIRAVRKELYRKQAVIRQQDHYKMISRLLVLGDKFNVETMNFKGLQKRSKETKVNDKGRFVKKKRFGKSLANKAPSMFLTMLDNKLKWYGERLHKIDTVKCKASQYNHLTGEYTKKELKDRWNKTLKIQRDLYSAFLIMNVNDDLKYINQEYCNETYDNFKILHDNEIMRLRELKAIGCKMLSSMGI